MLLDAYQNNSDILDPSFHGQLGFDDYLMYFSSLFSR